MISVTEVTDSDLGDDHWCTTEQVRDRLELNLNNQEPDYQTRIQEATDAMQSRWEGATGKTADDYPSDIPKLLQYATAYLAASEAHLHFAANVSGDNQGDQKPVFLESKADDKFDLWRQKADLEPGDDPTPNDDTDGIANVGGERSSLTDDIF